VVLTFILGLGMSLVLSMISGARELFTPGAWQRNGITYKIAPTASDKEQLLYVRKKKLRHLQKALWLYADGNGQQLPVNTYSSTVAPELWRTVHPTGARYEYRAGDHTLGGPPRVLAFEPQVYEAERWVLYTDGRIELHARAKLEQIQKK
jgi:hypothetical protein